jgi:hypothetical protein
MLLELLIVATLTNVGTILLGHFEVELPKWKRVLRLFLFLGLTALVTHWLGRPWSFVFIGALLIPALVVHCWWLPKHGINGWTGEPKDKYYALRGWKPKSRDAADEPPDGR